MFIFTVSFKIHIVETYSDHNPYSKEAKQIFFLNLLKIEQVPAAAGYHISGITSVGVVSKGMFPPVGTDCLFNIKAL